MAKRAYVLMLLVATLAVSTAYGEESPPRAPLDAAKYRQRCLMCHSASVPEGIADWVVKGVAPKPTPASAAAMEALRASNFICWRRCLHCWAD